MSDYKRFSRWQQIRINQLSYVSNLILALSIGIVGYFLNLIWISNSNLSFFQKLFFWVGFVLIILSILKGIILSIIRLENYRITAKIALINDKEEIGKNADKQNKNYLRIQSQKFDKWTYRFFYGQLITFSLSILLFIIFIFIEIKSKIT